jgi:hypothetical protein
MGGLARGDDGIANLAGYFDVLELELPVDALLQLSDGKLVLGV